MFILDNMEDFTPELKGWKLGIFLGATVTLVALAILVQATVYQTMKRLGSRVINQMIIPSQVNLELMLVNNWTNSL